MASSQIHKNDWNYYWQIPTQRFRSELLKNVELNKYSAFPYCPVFFQLNRMEQFWTDYNKWVHCLWFIYIFKLKGCCTTITKDIRILGLIVWFKALKVGLRIKFGFDLRRWVGHTPVSSTARGFFWVANIDQSEWK